MLETGWGRLGEKMVEAWRRSERHRDAGFKGLGGHSANQETKILNPKYFPE